MWEYDKAAFAQRLKILRKNSGMTQQVLAQALGVERSTYAYYETGKTSPDPAMLCRLAAAFRLSVDRLLGNELPTVTQLHDNSLILEDEELLRLSNLTPEEKVLILQYRQLKTEHQKDIRKQIHETLHET